MWIFVLLPCIIVKYLIKVLRHFATCMLNFLVILLNKNLNYDSKLIGNVIYFTIKVFNPFYFKAPIFATASHIYIKNNKNNQTIRNVLICGCFA